MSNERLMLKGVLAEKKELRNTLLLDLGMLRDSIRERLSPIVETLDVDVDQLRVLWQRYIERHAELRAAQETIDKLEAELYG